MADPARKYDPDYDPDPRLAQDPFNPVPPPLSDPARPESLTTDGEDPRVVAEERYAAPRRAGSGVLLAAIVLVLAALAFYLFSPGATEAPPPPAEPAATAPAEPAATAPAEPAPAPAEPSATAPTQPTEPAPSTQPAPAQQ